MTVMPAPLRVAVFNDTRRTLHYGCEIVMETLIAQLRQRGIEPVFFWPMGQDWRGRADVEAALRTVDGVVVNGEGSIHHSARRDRAHYLTEIARFARRKAGIPAYLINSSLHELEDRIIDNLRDFDAIYVRESRSLRVLEHGGIVAKVVPDLTLLASRSATTCTRAGVLGTDSVKRDVAVRLRALCRERGWHHSKLTHSARPAVAECGLRYEYLRRYGKWLHAVMLGRNTRTRTGFLDYLASHRLVCTGRFHAVALALATHTPFLAVESNTPKISGLLEDVFGDASRTISVAALEMVEDPDAHAWSAAEEEALGRFLHATRVRAAAMFDDLHDRLRARRDHG